MFTTMNGSLVGHCISQSVLDGGGGDVGGVGGIGGVGGVGGGRDGGGS